MASSDGRRLSVALVDVAAGREGEFLALTSEFQGLVAQKGYGSVELISDESVALRYYALRRWTTAASAAACHADPAAQALTAKMYQLAKVTHVVNGVRPDDGRRVIDDNRRSRAEHDRRTGFDRRAKNEAWTGRERRVGRDRRLGPRRLRDRPDDVDLIGAARRARENADAAFSHFKVGAALETADGTVITGCNVENATYGLTICAERVAMFKAISDGHRAFTRIAIVADTQAPTPPCGACRQILWEFGGNLEIHLANMSEQKGTHFLKDLLPLPFDARIL